MVWRPREAAFQDIGEGITKVAKMHLKKLREQKTSEEWLLEGNLYSSIDKYEDAFIAYDHALALDPTNASAYNNKSWIFNKLERYEEALAMSEQALLLDPQFSTAYANKILALNSLGKH